jgi:hypothetical protein
VPSQLGWTLPHIISAQFFTNLWQSKKKIPTITVCKWEDVYLGKYRLQEDGTWELLTNTLQYFVFGSGSTL